MPDQPKNPSADHTADLDFNNSDDPLASLFPSEELQESKQVPLTEERPIVSRSDWKQTKGYAHHAFVALWFKVLVRWAEKDSEVHEYLHNYDRLAVESLPRELLLIKEGARPACLSELPSKVRLADVLAVLHRILEITDGGRQKRFSGTSVVCANGAADFLWLDGLRLTKYFLYLESSETEQTVRKHGSRADGVPGEFQLSGGPFEIGEILGYVLPWRANVKGRGFGPGRLSLAFEFYVYMPGSLPGGSAVYTYAETLNKDDIAAANSEHGSCSVECKLAERIRAFQQVFKVDMGLEVVVKWTCSVDSFEDGVDPTEAAALGQFRSEFVRRIDALLREPSDLLGPPVLESTETVQSVGAPRSCNTPSREGAPGADSGAADYTAHGGPAPATARKRARLDASQSCVRRLPVTVLAGDLGAGKTTLLNHILTEQRDKKLAVIENEIGEVSVDDHLVEESIDGQLEELVVLNNAGTCCTIRGDLVTTLLGLAKRVRSGAHLDGVLVELTGAADPAPVVQSFMMDREVSRAFYVDNVVTLVDSKHFVEKLGESEADEAQRGTAFAQIAFSSTVLVNKTDLVDAERLEQVERRIKRVSSAAEIVRCQQAKVPVNKLFNVRAFNLSRVLEEQYMDEEEFSTFYKSRRDDSISSVGVRCAGAVNPCALASFLGKYLHDEETAADFLRVKAVTNVITDSRMYVVQCVHMLQNKAFTKRWPENALRENRIVIIGRRMQQRRQELMEGFLACVANPMHSAAGTDVPAQVGGRL